MWFHKRSSVIVNQRHPSPVVENRSVLAIYLHLPPASSSYLMSQHTLTLGLSWWLRCYSIHLQGRRPGFHPWVEKGPWRRALQAIPIFLPGESHGQREPGGLQSTGSQGVRQDWATNTFTLLEMQGPPQKWGAVTAVPASSAPSFW